MTDLNANPATLSAVMKAAKGGVTIRLAPGDYPTARPTKGMVKPSGFITVTSADPASRPRFMGGMTLDKAWGVHFVGVDFDISSATREDAGAVMTVGEGGDLAFKDCRFIGVAKPTGERLGRGLVLSKILGVTVENCQFDKLFRGAVFGGCEDVLVDECDFSDLGSDGIDLGQAKRVTIRRNQLVGFSPSEGDHPDGIQLATGAAGGGCEDITIEDNLIACGVGWRNQGVFTRTENVKSRHKRITVRRNSLVNSGNHAITIGGADAILVEDNVALFQIIPPEFAPKTSFANKSWIKTDSSNGVVRRNQAMSFISNPASVNDANVEAPAATQAQADAALAAWRGKFRPGKGPEVDHAAAQIASLTEQLTEAQAELASAQRTVASLQDQVSELTDERDEAKRAEANAQVMIAEIGKAALRAAKMAGVSA